MSELKITSFNCHAGLQARRNGVCDPYDLDAVLRSFDADVIVVQESWTPDAGVSGSSAHLANRASDDFKYTPVEATDW